MSDMPVEIVRSPRRKRTAQASLNDGRIRVMVPAGLDPAEEKRLVEEMTRRVVRRTSSAHIDLAARAQHLADRYGLPIPSEVMWSHRQMKRWGSCSPGHGTIRISSSVSTMPGWVLDWVLIHELAHLQFPDHGPEFKQMVSRYELGERAQGYLIARGEGLPEMS